MESNIMTSNELVELIDAAIERYTGPSDELESAIGAFMFGRTIGWRPLFLIHSLKTIKKYEAIMGVSFQEVFEPVIEENAQHLTAWKLAQKVSNFWKLVKGEVPNVRTPDWKNIR